MKKLAFVCELVGTVRQGGENIAMLRMANALKNMGLFVDTYTYTSTDPRLKINSIIPLKLRLIPFVREICCVPFIGYMLIKKINTHYDFIFASSMTIASFIKPKASLIIVCHLIRSQKFEKLSQIPKYRPLFNSLTYLIMSILEKNSLKNAYKIIVIREQQKKYLIKKLHIQEDKILVLPNGIDTDFFRPQNVKKKNQVIFVGRGTLPKGIDTLLAAADYIEATVLIVTPKIDTKFLKIAQEKNNVVIKYGATSQEMKRLYSESKVFVLPSLNEEQPLSTIEAMSCGLPVVVTNEAASDIAKTEINGYIVPEHDPKELSKKINFLLKENNLRKKIGFINRKHIIKNYDLKSLTLATKDILYE
jgi:glycosyltransferase involved in cell wall biosynthesis